MAELGRLVWKGDECLRLTEAEARRRLKMACIMVENTARQNLTPGGASGFKVSHGISGLRGSIRHEIEGPEGRVGSNLPYARIQELGGMTGAHTIRPIRARILHWIAKDGSDRFARSVKHPGSHIPPRPYLRPALWSNEAAIRELFARPMK